MSQQKDIQDAVREHLLQAGRAQVTRFVDDLTATVREEVDEFTKAAWEVHNKD